MSSHPYSVRLPSGQVRPFSSVLTFQAYVQGWPDDEYIKVWPLPFCCLIQSRKAPF